MEWGAQRKIAIHTLIDRDTIWPKLVGAANSKNLIAQ